MTLPDLRPATPAHLAVAGVTFWLIGALLHFAVLTPFGLTRVLVAALDWMLRPHSHTSYWRGRLIELADDATALGHCLYQALFRR